MPSQPRLKTQWRAGAAGRDTSRTIATATRKVPAACPYCEGRGLIRKGRRRKKLEIVQLWQCSHCRRVFTPAPALARGTTYPPRVILDALTTYNLGHSLTATGKKLRSRWGYRISTSTLSRWLSDHATVTPYRRLRTQGLKLYPAQNTIRAVKLYHRQVYEFAYHRPKLALMCASREHGRFARLADFLQAVPKRCPHALFQASTRASQSKPDLIEPSRLLAVPKQNMATRTAAFVLATVADNRLRHERLQRFLLANDSVTLATEVPIWLSEPDIAAIEARRNIKMLPTQSGANRVITGHIDLVQVRNGALRILDYKPDARTNRPFVQLTIYALALAHLTGLRLFDITCAWFNEEEYCEFFPRNVLKHIAR